MKKVICIILILILLLSSLTGCQLETNNSINDMNESNSTIITNNNEQHIMDITDSNSSYDPLINGPRDLDIYAERKGFFYSYKDSWGIKDMAIYTLSGETIVEAKAGDDMTLETKRVYAVLSDYEEAVTYRGIAIGDDSYNALKHMCIPREALFVLSNGGGAEMVIPYDLELLYNLVEMDGFSIDVYNTWRSDPTYADYSDDQIKDFATFKGYIVETVIIFFDKDFNPIEIINAPNNDSVYSLDFGGMVGYSIGDLFRDKAVMYVSIQVNSYSNKTNSMIPDFIINDYQVIRYS